jgi:hypothetical protein
VRQCCGLVPQHSPYECTGLSDRRDREREKLIHKDVAAEQAKIPYRDVILVFHDLVLTVSHLASFPAGHTPTPPTSFTNSHTVNCISSLYSISVQSPRPRFVPNSLLTPAVLSCPTFSSPLFTLHKSYSLCHLLFSLSFRQSPLIFISFFSCPMSSLHRCYFSPFFLCLPSLLCRHISRHPLTGCSLIPPPPIIRPMFRFLPSLGFQ